MNYDAIREEQEIVARIRETTDFQWPDVRVDFACAYPDGDEANLDDLQIIEGWNAIIVNYDGKTTYPAMVSDHYRLIPHEVVYDGFMRKLKEIPEYEEPEIKVDFLADGSQCEITAKFIGTKVKVGKRDDVSPIAGFKNSYDTRIQLSGFGGAFTWRCSNGMYSGHMSYEFKKKHRMNLDLDYQLDLMVNGMGKMSEQFDIWNNWASKTIGGDECFELINGLPTVSEKQTEKILALPETGTGITLESLFKKGNKADLWTVNSILTQWLTHELELSAGRRQREEKIAMALHRSFGAVK